MYKIFYKKQYQQKPHFFKTLVEWFQAVANMLRPLRYAHPRAYSGEKALCHAPPPHTLGHGSKQKSAKYRLKSRNHIIIKHACGRDLLYLVF